MTKAEIIERYGYDEYIRRLEYSRKKNNERYQNDPEFRAKHKADFKLRYNNDSEYRKRHNATCVKSNMKKYNSDPEYKKDMMNKHNNYMKEYNKDELNNIKHKARTISRRILFKQRQHINIKGYEIHHCFGYDDPSKFIYIPRSLHRAIHSFLKENNINADTDHYKYISTMINKCTEYTYISA